MTLLDIPGSVPVKLTRNADDTISFAGGAAGAVFENVTAAVTASLGFLIVLASCDGTASVLKVVHAAGTITGTNTPGAAASLDLTADWFLGSDGGAAEFLDADTALWWIDGRHIDFADADNIEQFWDTTGDTLRDPGADGSNPRDGASSPLVCHKSSAASHTTNVGTGGNADTAGVFTDGASPGSYAGDFAPAATITLTDSASSTANAGIYTFTARSLGAAASDRLMAITLHTEVVLAGTPTVSGVTVGGVTTAETILTVGSNGSARTLAGIYIVALPTGTTADIMVTLGFTGVRCSITVHRITGIPSATAHDTLSATGDPVTGTLTIPNGGVVLGAATGNDSTTTSWTNITEREDGTSESSMTFSAANDVFVMGANLTLTATFASPSTQDAGAFATWSP